MLLDLPPELLDLIADHLEEDRATLKACCMVSRAFKDATQPVWWRNIRLDGSFTDATDFARLAAGGLGRHARSLFAWAAQAKDAFPPTALLAALPKLEVMKISSASLEMSEVNLASLEGSDNLLHLRLFYLIADTLALSSSFTFPRLSTLSLLSLDSPRRVVEDLLSPSVVPTLCVLAVADLQEGGQTYLPSLTTELLDQLDMLEVQVTDLNLLPTVVLDHPTPTLVRLDTTRLSGRLPILQVARPRHLSVDAAVEARLRRQSQSPEASRHALADRFYDSPRTAVNIPSSRLATLWLPTTLHLDHPSSDSVLPTLLPLLEDCRQREVDVRWVGEAKQEDGFQRAFWRYAKEKKRGMQDQEQQLA